MCVCVCVVCETPLPTTAVTGTVFATVELGGAPQTNDEEGSAHEEPLAPPTDNGAESPNGGSGGFGGKDISRRFERQSWRERHAEERRRLKHRFEVRDYVPSTHTHTISQCTIHIMEACVCVCVCVCFICVCVCVLFVCVG